MLSDQSGTHCADQAGLERAEDAPASVSPVLALQPQTTPSSWFEANEPAMQITLRTGE